jgi:hypothetical protein
MNSMAFSPSSKSNSKIDGKQITFGTIDFQPHPHTLAPVFAGLDQEMDLTTGSFNFHVGSLGSVRLSDPINSGPSAGKAATTAALENSVGSSSEVNSPVSINLTKEITMEEIDEIMETLKLDLEESSGYTGSDSKSSNYSEEDVMACYGNVSDNSENTWKSGLELYSVEQTTLSSGSSSDVDEG